MCKGKRQGRKKMGFVENQKYGRYWGSKEWKCKDKARIDLEAMTELS